MIACLGDQLRAVWRVAPTVRINNRDVDDYPGKRTCEKTLKSLSEMMTSFITFSSQQTCAEKNASVVQLQGA
jgi:hypothetical protein